MTRKISFLVVVILFGIAGLKAQNLDRMSLSSGGSATDNVNYVLGETFNFTMADGATVILESGTLGSTDDTGGENNFVKVQELAQTLSFDVYPNPATDVVNLNFVKVQNFDKVGKQAAYIAVYDHTGRTVMLKNKAETIAVNQLPAGTYFIALMDARLQPIASAQFVKR